ncbi:hypothetical protein R6Q59_027083 [Mikania micrantha]
MEGLGFKSLPQRKRVCGGQGVFPVGFPPGVVVVAHGRSRSHFIQHVSGYTACIKVKYYGYLVEKYGDERSNHPKFDEVLWSRAAGGNNKRKVYVLSCVNDLNAHGRWNPENEKLNEIIKEILKEKEEEKERLNGTIAELEAEKEKHKKEKETMSNRMQKIEDMLKF